MALLAPLAAKAGGAAAAHSAKGRAARASVVRRYRMYRNLSRRPGSLAGRRVRRAGVAPRQGLGVTVQLDPSQCSVSVVAAEEVPAWPTAQTSVAEVACTAANTSVAGSVASAGRGLAARAAVPHDAGCRADLMRR
jgi:hypothetical protein